MSVFVGGEISKSISAPGKTPRPSSGLAVGFVSDGLLVTEVEAAGDWESNDTDRGEPDSGCCCRGNFQGSDT